MARAWWWLLVVFAGCGDRAVATTAPVLSPETQPESEPSDGGTAVTLQDREGVPAPEEEAPEMVSTTSLVQALRRRADQLEERARLLDEREHELHQLEQAIEERLARLEKARDAAKNESDRLAFYQTERCAAVAHQCEENLARLGQECRQLVEQARGETGEDPEVERLAQALAAMRPDQAAAMIATALDPATAVRLLRRVPDRLAGRVLAALGPEKAAPLMQRLVGQALIPP